jgi:hypothetical protein
MQEDLSLEKIDAARLANEEKAPEERGVEDKRLDYRKDVYWFGRRNDACISLGLRNSSRSTPIYISKRGPRGGEVGFYVTVSVEDLRRLAQACLNFADLVDDWSRNP